MKTALAHPEDACLYCQRPCSRVFCTPDCRQEWWMEVTEKERTVKRDPPG